MKRVKEELKKLLGLIREEAGKHNLSPGQERQSLVWQGKEPDFLPLLVYGPVPERENYARYDLKEQFYDPEKMLYEQLWTALAVLRGKADGLPSVRVNFGTGFLASVFGLSQEIFPDRMPWLQQHLNKKQLLSLSPEKLEPLEEKGLLPACRDYLSVYQGYLKETPVKIFLPDTQGVFDLAHLVYGDNLFYEFYDDFAFVEHLLTLSAYVYQRASQIIKGWIKEPLKASYHSNCLYADGCGVRSCEDSTTLLSPGLIEKVLPFSLQAVSPFGGWFHFCGKNEFLLEKLLQAGEVVAVNFGNPEKFCWEETLPGIEAAGKVYFGTVPRKEDESLSVYFRRILSYLSRKGTIILIAPVRSGENCSDARAFWYESQEKIFK